MAKPRNKPQLSLDSAHVCDDLGGIPPDHWCFVFFAEIFSALDDEGFGGMYQEGGRAPISPRLLACMTLLQYSLGLSDRQMMEWAVMHRACRIALGIPRDWEAPSATVLVDFRKRLMGQPIREGLPAPEEQHGGLLLFNKILQRAAALGVLPKTTKVRVDATHVLADVAVLSRADMVQEAIRVVVCEAHKHYAALHERPEFMELYERYCQENWLGTGRATDEALVALGLAGRALLELCGELEVRGKDTLARILAENFIWVEQEAPQPLPADQRPADHIVTPHDPDAQAGKKRSTVWTGDKAHVIETAEPEEQNLIIGVLSTSPRVDDGKVLDEIIAQAREALPDVDTVIADAGYASADNSKAAGTEGIDLVAPPRPDSSTNGIRASEFEIDHEAKVARCPEGKHSRVWSEKPDEITIRFSPADCRQCPRREQCTRSKQGRSLGLHKEHAQLARDRQRAQEPEFKQLYRLRAAIEGTISQLVRKVGLRRSRYRGAAGRALHAVLACAALNTWRVVRYLSDPQECPPRARSGTRMPAATPVGL